MRLALGLADYNAASAYLPLSLSRCLFLVIGISVFIACVWRAHSKISFTYPVRILGSLPLHMKSFYIFYTHTSFIFLFVCNLNWCCCLFFSVFRIFPTFFNKNIYVLFFIIYLCFLSAIQCNVLPSTRSTFAVGTLWFLVDIKLHFHVATFVFKATPTCCTNCIVYTLSIRNKRKTFNFVLTAIALCHQHQSAVCLFFSFSFAFTAQQKQEERGKHFMAHLCSFLFRFFLRVFVYVLITFMWLIYVEGSRHKMPAVSASRVSVCVCVWVVRVLANLALSREGAQ